MMNQGIKSVLLARVVATLLSLVIVSVIDFEMLFSVFVGSLACLVPETYQAWRLNKTESEFEPAKWLRMVYQAVISKWLMTVMIFVICFSSKVEWNFVALFSGYALVSVSGLLTPVFIKGKN